MSFRNKIILLLLVAIGISAVFPAFSLYEMNSFDKDFKVYVGERVNEYVNTSEMNKSLIRYDSNLWKFVASGNPNWLKDAQEAKRALERNIAELLQVAEGNIELTSAVQRIQTMQEEYFRKAEVIAQSRGTIEEKSSKLTKEYNEILVKVFNETNRLNELKQNKLREASVSVREQVNYLKEMGAILAAIFLPILIALGIVIYVTTASPIEKLTKIIKSVSENDFKDMSAVVKGSEEFIEKRKSNDEISRLARALRNFGQQIEDKTRELENLVITDEKTKLFNFRHFKSELQAEIARAKRFGEAVSLIMIDADKFKHYNDTNGHILGDEALIKMAKLMKSLCRETDKPARFGGEEFAILLPRTTKEEAVVLAERIRKAIEDAVFVNQEKQPGGNFTASLGVASYPEDCTDAETLINAADKALYKAKEKGRNRVETAPSLI
ncbi:MAG: diguanylate cyclase [Chloroherpetonaceae bacterium]|nr:diguanylate cyclase [Chloroherpetonaceae bacterium]MDW8437533.1 diguanylate cyclase [Chloroherpetonaceae bacterium]